MNVKVIDISTGENLSDQYTLRHKHQDDAFKRRQSESAGRQREFTFGNMLNIPEVVARIDDKYCGYLLYLQTYINYAGTLVSSADDPMTRADIQKALGLADRAFKSFIKAMVDNEIIAHENGCYCVNPAYHFKGKTENKHVIKTFTTKVRSLYNVRNANKLGFIYKLLPFIHFETNTVCVNPYEMQVELITQLSKQDIAEITGVSEKTVYTYLRRMKLGDEYVFAEIRRGKHRYYKLNPFIFYRRNGEPDATLREMFRLGFSGK